MEVNCELMQHFLRGCCLILDKLQNCRPKQNLIAFPAPVIRKERWHEVHPSQRWGEIYFRFNHRTAQLADIKHPELHAKSSAWFLL